MDATPRRAARILLMVPAAALLLLGLNSGLLQISGIGAAVAIVLFAVTAVTVSLGERGRRRARVAS